MANESSVYAAQLRRELGLRNRMHARGRLHVESYGNPPVIVYGPQNGRHGNFFDAAYAAIAARPEWVRRFDKIHAQGRALPRPEADPFRRWRELDSSMSSDALLMNVFCTPGVVESATFQQMLGVESGIVPVFGWKARVPLRNGRFDRTEVDMRLASLLVEAKLTESDFQTREASIVEAYRDFEAVFDRDLLLRVKLRTVRRRSAIEFPEDFTQEWEPSGEAADEPAAALEALAFQSAIVSRAEQAAGSVASYAGYQLIRNVLAAHAEGCSFCVVLDARRPDLREAWFEVMMAVKSADLRVRLKVLTWQEIAPLLPEALKEFLDLKYGIVEPGSVASVVEDTGGIA